MFFILTAAWTVPAAIVLLLVIARGPAAAKGEYKFPERETEA